MSTLVLCFALLITPTLSCSATRTTWKGYTYEEPIGRCFISGSYSVLYNCIDTNKVQVKRTTGTTCTGSLDSWFEAADGYDDNYDYDPIRITCTPDCVTETPSPTTTPTIGEPTTPTSNPSKAPTAKPITATPTTPLQDPKNCLKTTNIEAWYDGRSLDLSNNQWTDKTGNNHHGIIGGNDIAIFSGKDSENELYLNGQHVVYGSPQTTITFGSTQFIVPNHTIFNVCKYRQIGFKGRILQAHSYNGFYGFWSGLSGVAFEYDWITQTQRSKFGTNWVLSSQRTDLYRGNGQDLTILGSVTDVQSNTRLGIHTGLLADEISDWACGEILIVNSRLDIDEIQCIEEYLTDKYDLSNDKCIQTSDTDSYGPGTGGTPPEITLYQHRVNEISSWCLNGFYGAVANFSWNSDLNNPSSVYGGGYCDGRVCTGFKLDNDEYINGYRAVYDNYFYGVAFYTNKDNVYECIDETNIISKTDTGMIILDNYYLSGFNIRSGDIVDQMGFQFTSFDNGNCVGFDEYILVPIAKTWFDAQRYCKEMFGSDLATVITDQQIEIAAALRNDLIEYNDYSIWVGLTDNSNVTSEGEWGWIDGFVYTENDVKWDINEPNNAGNNEHCAYMVSNNLLNDGDCNTELMFLCMPPTPSPTRSPITRSPTTITSNPTDQPTGEESDIYTSMTDKGSNKLDWIMIKIIILVAVLNCV